jgi:hypothetical protein
MIVLQRTQRGSTADTEDGAIFLCDLLWIKHIKAGFRQQQYKFAPVSARYVRLNILKASEVPTNAFPFR